MNLPSHPKISFSIIPITTPFMLPHASSSSLFFHMNTWCVTLNNTSGSMTLSTSTLIRRSGVPRECFAKIANSPQPSSTAQKIEKAIAGPVSETCIAANARPGIAENHSHPIIARRGAPSRSMAERDSPTIASTANNSNAPPVCRTVSTGRKQERAITKP